MQILIHPRPIPSYSAGLVLYRISEELKRRGYRCRSTFFHYFGYDLVSWGYAFLMGTPRFLGKILRSGKPMILTMGLPAHRDMYEALGMTFSPSLLRQEEEMLAAICTVPKVVFVSEFAREKWREIFSDRHISFPADHRNCVIYHPVDTQLFSPQFQIKKQDDVFVIGSVGYFRRRGRLKVLFALSQRLRFNHRLLLVGKIAGECLEEFSIAMSDPVMAARIEFRPWISNRGLADSYNEMHCLLHAMHGESFCLTVAEALCCGVPVIIPRYGAPAEYLPDRAGAIIDGPRWLWPSAVIDQIELEVSRIRANWLECSRAARSVANLFATERVVDQYLNFMGLDAEGK